MNNVWKKMLVGGLAVIMVSGLVGCQSKEAIIDQEDPMTNPQEKVKAGDVTVLVAASLTDAMKEIKTMYEQQHPGAELFLSFGGSGALAQQIENGAPADVFFSAGKKQMDGLVKKDLIEASSVENRLQNKIVLIAPSDNTTITSFEDLAKPVITKIGIGDPASVPAGQYTEEVYRNMKLTESLKDKLVIASDVRQVLSWVETGNVEAGTVYETDAKMSDKVKIVAIATQDTHKPIVYPVGLVKEAKDKESARAFMEYLSSEEAIDIFVKYGFTPVEGK